MLDDVQQDLFTRIKNSRKAQLVRAERKRLEKDALKTKKWTEPLLKQFNKFYKARHKRRNLFQSRVASVDVSFDILSTIHESDTLRYTGDILASVVGEHTMTQLVNNAWRERMHNRNYQKTKYFQILASHPGRLGKRKRYTKKVATATYAAYQFAAFSRGDKKDIPALSKVLKLPKPQLQKFVTDEHKLTAEAVKYENPSCNPFSFKKQTLLDSFAATPFNDPPHKHQYKTKLQLQIEYASRAKIQRFTYSPANKKARKTKRSRQ